MSDENFYLSKTYGIHMWRVRNIIEQSQIDYTLFKTVFARWIARLGGDPVVLKLSELGNAWETLHKESEASGRSQFLVVLETVYPPVIPYSIMAVCLQDRVGPSFTKRQFELLTDPLHDYLLILDTEGSLRDLAVNLLSTFPADKAIEAAKLTLG